MERVQRQEQFEGRQQSSRSLSPEDLSTAAAAAAAGSDASR